MSSDPGRTRTGTATSVIFPLQPDTLSVPAAFARAAVEAGANRLWFGQSHNIETFSVMSALAGMGARLPMGTAVSLTVLAPPYTAALQARSVAALTGHPVTACFGPGRPEQVGALLGQPYDRPAATTAQYVGEVRSLLAGKDGAEPPLPEMDHPPVEVGAGVLRPGMARAVASTAEAVVTWLTPPAYLEATLVPALGGDSGPRLVTVVHAAVARPGRDPVSLAEAACGGHVVLPHYGDMLRRAGVDVTPENPRRGAASLVREGVFVYGSPAEIARGLESFRAAGVDEVVVNVAGVLFEHGLEEAVRDLREIVTAANEG